MVSTHLNMCISSACFGHGHQSINQLMTYDMTIYDMTYGHLERERCLWLNRWRKQESKYRRRRSKQRIVTCFTMSTSEGLDDDDSHSVVVTFFAIFEINCQVFCRRGPLFISFLLSLPPHCLIEVAAAPGILTCPISGPFVFTPNASEASSFGFSSFEIFQW